jgi:hypothetical protein
MKDREIQEKIQHDILRPCFEMMMSWIMAQAQMYVIHACVLIGIWTLLVSGLMFGWSCVFA